MASYTLPPLRPAVDDRRQTLTFVGRLVLAAAVLGAGYSMMVRFGNLLNDHTRPTSATCEVVPASTNESANSFAGLPMAELAGRWEFVEGSWSLGVGSFASSQVPSFFARPVSSAAPAAAVDDWERIVLDLVRNYKPAATTQGSHRVYRIESPGLRAEVVVSPSEKQERLLAARAVIQKSLGEWSTFETERTTDVPGGTAGSALLPRPDRAELLAIRRDAADRVVGEFSRCESNIAALLAFWRSAGCPVTLKSAQDASDFGEGVCECAGRRLRVILWEPQSQGVTTFLVLDGSANDDPLSNSLRKLAP